MQRYFNLLLVLLVLGTAACDSNGSDGDGPSGFGSASIEVTGDDTAETEFNGFALFSIVTDEEEEYLNLVIADAPLSGSDEVRRIVTFQRLGGRPGTGEYSIGSEGVLAIYMAETNDENSVLVGGIAGTFTVTRSTDTRLEGTFTFTGPEFTSEEETTVSGTFKAVFVEDDNSIGGDF